VAHALVVLGLAMSGLSDVSRRAQACDEEVSVFPASSFEPPSNFKRVAVYMERGRRACR